MRRAFIWVLIVLAIAAGVGGIVWRRQTREPQPIGDVLRSGEIVQGDLQLMVAASGNLAVKERTDLVVRVPGLITEVGVSPGTRVEKDEILARMDTATMERTVEQAEVALAQAELSLQTVQEPVDEEDVVLAETALTSAAKALEVARLGRDTARIDGEAMVIQAQRQRENIATQLRDETDWQKQDGLRTALEDAEAQERIARLNAKLMNEQADAQWQSALARYEQAQRNLETLQADPDEDQVRQRELQVEQAQLRLDQAQQALNDSTIVAPYDGVIANVYIEAGTYQRTGSPAFTLVDDAAYYVDVTIDEIDIGVVAIEQQAEVVLDAYPKASLVGIVERIAPASTNLGGLVAYQVRLRVEAPGDVRLMDGLTASVSVETRLVEDVLLIPNWAVRIDQEAAQAYTYRMVEGQPVRTTIEVGRRNDTFSEVVSGLSAGDEIALIAEERESPIPQGPFGN